MNIGQAYPEELFSGIDLIYLHQSKRFMQCVFQCGGVITFDDRMHIEGEGDRSIAQLPNTVHRLQAACHTDFVDVFAKRTDVRDHIYIATLGLLGHGKGTLVLFFSFHQLLLQFCQLGLILGFLFLGGLLHGSLSLLHSLSEHGLLLSCLLLSALILTAGLFFLPHLLTKLALLFLLLGLQLMTDDCPF